MILTIPNIILRATRTCTQLCLSLCIILCLILSLIITFILNYHDFEKLFYPFHIYGLKLILIVLICLVASQLTQFIKDLINSSFLLAYNYILVKEFNRNQTTGEFVIFMKLSFDYDHCYLAVLYMNNIGKIPSGEIV